MLKLYVLLLVQNHQLKRENIEALSFHRENNFNMDRMCSIKAIYVKFKSKIITYTVSAQTHRYYDNSTYYP